MYKNKLVKMIIGIFIVLLIVSIPIVILIKTKSKCSIEIIDPGIVILLPGFTYAHIEIIEEDERDLFYYYYNIGLEEPKVFSMKLLTFEIKELFIHDYFQLNKSDHYYKEGDIIQIAFESSLYELVSDYNEFIVDTQFSREDLYDENEKGVIYNAYVILQLNREKPTINHRILPVKDGKLDIQDYIDQGLLTSHILFDGNSFLDDETYKVKDGLSIEGLRQYFTIVVDRIEKANKSRRPFCYG
jgi:hypothetical protein